MEHFISRDGMKICYTVDDFTDPWTRREPMLLLHAAMGNAVRWFRWVPALGRRFSADGRQLMVQYLRSEPAGEMWVWDWAGSVPQVSAHARITSQSWA